MAKKPRKPRSDSKMYQLPKSVQVQVDKMLVDGNMSYRDIKEWLQINHDLSISKSSISNYAFRVFKAAERLAKELESTRLIVDYIGENSDVDTLELSTSILKSGLLQRFTSAEEEFSEMPIDTAGRLLIQLNKSDIAMKKMQFEQQSKMETALNSLEIELSESLKLYPELAKEFQIVMEKARNQLFSDNV